MKCDKIYRFIASAGGIGYLPQMPGTWGSLIGLLLSWIGLKFLTLSVFCVFTLSIFLLGWWVSARIVRESPESADPSWIVIDEIVGQAVAMIGLTVAFGCGLNAWMWLLAFLSFRFFDIFKIWPIGWIERKLKGGPWVCGLGIMFDDVVAGWMAADTIEFCLKIYTFLQQHHVL